MGMKEGDMVVVFVVCVWMSAWMWGGGGGTPWGWR